MNQSTYETDPATYEAGELHPVFARLLAPFAPPQSGVFDAQAQREKLREEYEAGFDSPAADGWRRIANDE